MDTHTILKSVVDLRMRLHQNNILFYKKNRLIKHAKEVRIDKGTASIYGAQSGIQIASSHNMAWCNFNTALAPYIAYYYIK